MNDQSTRNCAWGDTATCTPEIQGTSSGWPRFTPPAVSSPGQEHRQWSEGSTNIIATAGGDAGGGGVGGVHHSNEGGCVANSPAGAGGVCGSNGTRRSWPGHDTDSSGDTPVTSDPARAGAGGVEYRLHEFGLLSPLQGFAHWPGFSLNPALWDLERLHGSYRRKYGRKFEFDPADIRSGVFIVCGCSFPSVWCRVLEKHAVARKPPPPREVYFGRACCIIHSRTGYFTTSPDLPSICSSQKGFLFISQSVHGVLVCVGRKHVYLSTQGAVRRESWRMSCFDLTEISHPHGSPLSTISDISHIYS